MIPLSTRMRPDNLDDFVGQEHFLYKGSLLYNAIKNGTFESAIFSDLQGRERLPWRGSSHRKWTAGLPKSTLQLQEQRN